MAERTSTRGGSRRTTPQPTAASTRPSRTTRSQSREISESEASHKGESRQRGSSQRGTATSSRRRAGKGRGEEAPVRQDLSTVDESLGNDSDLDDQTNKEQHLASTAAEPSRRVSGFSGTTARNSGSTRDLDLPNETTIDALPDLWQVSDKILGLLTPKDSSFAKITQTRSFLEDALRHEQLQEPLKYPHGKRVLDNLTRLNKSFDTQLQYCNFRDSDEVSIPTLDILRVWFNTEDDIQLLNSDAILKAILHAGNLAVLASNILLYPNREDTQFLETLQGSFPRDYTDLKAMSDDSGGSKSLQECAQLAIDTRTQYAIVQLERHFRLPEFETVTFLRNIFFQSDGKLKGWNFPSMTAEEMPKSVKDLLTNRINEIIQIMRIDVESGDPRIPIARLKEVYSWSDYAAKFANWISRRHADIQARLKSVESSTEFTEALEHEIHTNRQPQEPLRTTDEIEAGIDEDADDADDINLRMDFVKEYEPSSGISDVDARSKRQGNLTTQFSRMSGNFKQLPRDAALAVMLNKKAASTAGRSAQASTPAQTQKREQMPASAPARSTKDMDPVVTDDSQPEPVAADSIEIGETENQDEDDDDSFQTQQRTERILQLERQREAESNKENQSGRQHLSSDTGTKRRIFDRQEGASKVTWDTQDSQDGGQIEEDEISIDGENARPSSARNQQAHHRQTAKRSALEPARDHDRSTKRARREDSIPDRMSRDRSQQSQPSQILSQQEASARAASQIAMNRSRSKPPQTKRGWSQEESDTLMGLIGQYGASWSLLKQADDGRDRILALRGQVALKDRARNMKVNWLIAGCELPPSFDKVPLGKKEIERVENALGYNTYDRKTGDILRR